MTNKEQELSFEEFEYAGFRLGLKTIEAYIENLKKPRKNKKYRNFCCDLVDSIIFCISEGNFKYDKANTEMGGALRELIKVGGVKNGTYTEDAHKALENLYEYSGIIMTNENKLRDPKKIDVFQKFFKYVGTKIADLSRGIKNTVKKVWNKTKYGLLAIATGVVLFPIYSIVNKAPKGTTKENKIEPVVKRDSIKDCTKDARKDKTLTLSVDAFSFDNVKATLEARKEAYRQQLVQRDSAWNKENGQKKVSDLHPGQAQAKAILDAYEKEQAELKKAAAKAKAAAEAKQRQEMAEKARKEEAARQAAIIKAKKEAEDKRKAEQIAKARKEAEAKQKAEAAKAKAAAEAKQKAEAAKAKAAAEAKQKAEAAKAKAAAEAKAKAEAAKAKAETKKITSTKGTITTTSDIGRETNSLLKKYYDTKLEMFLGATQYQKLDKKITSQINKGIFKANGFSIEEMMHAYVMAKEYGVKDIKDVIQNAIYSNKKLSEAEQNLLSKTIDRVGKTGTKLQKELRDQGKKLTSYSVADHHQDQAKQHYKNLKELRQARGIR